MCIIVDAYVDAVSDLCEANTARYDCGAVFQLFQANVRLGISLMLHLATGLSTN